MKSPLLIKLRLLSLLALGCEDALEPGSRVDSLRVLAEQADLPSARPGEEVTLSSLAYDPEQRPITWASDPAVAGGSRQPGRGELDRAGSGCAEPREAATLVLRLA